MNCNPLIGAVLDFWQTDSKGEYDNEGFTLKVVRLSLMKMEIIR